MERLQLANHLLLNQVPKTPKTEPLILCRLLQDEARADYLRMQPETNENDKNRVKFSSRQRNIFSP